MPSISLILELCQDPEFALAYHQPRPIHFVPGMVAVIMGRVTISVVFMPRFGLVFWASEIAALITRPIRIRGMQNIASSLVLRIGP